MSTPKRNNRTSIIEADLLIAAYAAGYFPMADARDGPIHWYSPDPRAIIPLSTFKVSRSLHQTMKKHIFDIRLDTSFEKVIRSCAQRKETWISESIVQSYLALHKRRLAHSVETWHNNVLVGGLYGVALGAAFFGESMFSRMRDASKVALVHLVHRLCEKGFELLDTQFLTPHLEHFGAMEMSRGDYLKLLAKAVVKRRTFLD